MVLPGNGGLLATRALHWLSRSGMCLESVVVIPKPGMPHIL